MNSLYSPRQAQQAANGARTDFDARSHYNFGGSYQDSQSSLKTMDQQADADNSPQSINFEPEGSSFLNGNLGDTQQSSRSRDHEYMLDPASAWSKNSFGFDNMFLPTGQNKIVQQRPDTVQQHFGQVTPPDDVLSDADSNKKRGTPVEKTESEKAKSEKSERARNAANHRHAKTKQQRRDSRQSQASPQSEDDGPEDKKEKYREKNRVAAAKCRAKKKTNIETIGERHRDLSAMNNLLKKQVQELRGELTGLRTVALNHQDCNCQISRYNMNQARKMAMGADERGMPTGYGSFGATTSPRIGNNRNQSMAGVPTSGAMEGFTPNQQLNGLSGYAFPSPEEMEGLHGDGDHFEEYMQSGFEGMDFSQT